MHSTFSGGERNNFETIEKSIELLLDSKIDCEFRTTLAKSVVSEKDVVEIREWMKGAKYRVKELKDFKPLVGDERETIRACGDCFSTRF